jgi:hypothetical protein
LLISLLFFVSCETEIDVSLPEYKNELVVEGWIEPGEPAKVSLSKSVPYLSTINMNTLYEDVIVKDAIVTVQDEHGLIDTLVLVQNNEAPLYWYYTSPTLRGELNSKYTLKIDWNGKKYSSTTTIQDTMVLDSVYLDNFQSFESDTIKSLKVKFQDQPGTKDYYLFKVKIANEIYTDRVWLTSFPIALDDVAFPGAPYTGDILRFGTSEFYMPDNLSQQDSWEYYRPYYSVGDTIYLKASKIDYNSFRFLSSAGSTMYFGVNPFTNPPQIYSNITSETGDKCLGVWMGCASTMRKIIF